MKIKLYYLLIVSVILAIGLASAACEGPTGSDGPQGLQGEQGPEGPQGDEGTANVIYSEWLDVDWNGADESDYKRMDIIEPLITEEFMNTGTVLMYLYSSEGNEGVVFALPFASGHGQTFAFFMRPEGFSIQLPGTFPEESGLSFYIQRTDGVASGGIDRIRYVLIPDGVPGKMKSDFFDSYQAAEYFGIPD